MSDITIGRTFDELTAKVKEFDAGIKSNQREVRELNQGLRLSQGNSVELIKQKYQAFETQLVNTKQKADFLRQQMAMLNEKKEQGIPLTNQEIAQLERLEQQLASTEIQVTSLTAAIGQKSRVIAKAQYGTMEQDLRRTQNELRNMNQLLSTTTSMMGIMGATGDQSGDNVMRGMRTAMSGMQAVIGLSSLLQSTNNTSASTFQRLATSATMAMGAFALGSTIINQFGGESQRTVGIIMSVAGALGAAAIAALAFKGVLSWGAAVPMILASVGAGAAGLSAIFREARQDVEEISGLSSNIGFANFQGGGTGARMPSAHITQTAQSTLSQQSIEVAVYNAVTRAVNSTGLNRRASISETRVTAGEIVRFIFDDFLDENSRQNNPLVVR